MFFGTLYNFMHPIGSVMIMSVKVTKQFYLYKHFNNSLTPYIKSVGSHKYTHFTGKELDTEIKCL